MAFDNRDIKPRKKSYYPFSKNYPGRRSGTSYAIGESRTRKKKEKRKKIVFSVFLVLFFVLIFVVATVSINLSKKPYEHELTGVPAEYDGKLRALYMPDDVLDGGIAFDLFKTELTETKANAVVIDFKTKDGYLNYVSSVGTANDIGASSKAYQNTIATIDRLKSAGYKIIARIYCYEGSVAASHLGAAAAVTNSDGTLWLDNSAQHDGEPWLNPYSPVAGTYLLSIVSEVSSLGVDAVILDSVEFPESIYLDKAVFSGEEKSIESRNAVLHSFIEKVKSVLGEVVIDDAVLHMLKSGEKAASPGMKYKHYAPKADVTIVKGSFDAFRRFVAEKGDCFVLCFEGEEKYFKNYVTYGRADDPSSQANRLFDALRELDEKGAKTVYARDPGTSGVDLAVYNRLIRAAAFKTADAK